jgi:hypothetical protein
MFGGWIGIPIIAVTLFPEVAPPGYMGASAVVAAWILGPWISAWLWWSISIPKWRVWAMERSDDWNALACVAISFGLIWDEKTLLGRFFEKTEIWSARDRQREIELRRNRAS